MLLIYYIFFQLFTAFTQCYVINYKYYSHILSIMTRPKKWIPLKDIKGLLTLLSENKTQEEIVEYYSDHGLYYDRTTISKRLKELRK